MNGILLNGFCRIEHDENQSWSVENILFGSAIIFHGGARNGGGEGTIEK